MPNITVNPTRMELTRLKGKLRTAQRGHKLLKDKRDELMKQFLDTVREVRALRQEVEEELMTVHGAFTVASALMSSQALEQALLDRLNLTQVNVMPVPKAGGSTGAAAYQRFEHPAVAQFIQADAAIDVGDTLVGMHVRPVAVPVRMEGSEVGQAHVTMAYSRLPYIGGSRAQYPNG